MVSKTRRVLCKFLVLFKKKMLLSEVISIESQNCWIYLSSAKMHCWSRSWPKTAFCYSVGYSTSGTQMSILEGEERIGVQISGVWKSQVITVSDQNNFVEWGVLIRFGFLCHCNLRNRPLEGIVKCFISQYPLWALVVVMEMDKRIEKNSF